MPALAHGAARAAAPPARHRCSARRGVVAARAAVPHPPPAPPAASLPRRVALALAPLAAAVALLPRRARAAPPDEEAPLAPAASPLFFVRDGPDDPSQRAYGTIAAALDAAPAGATVRVAAGYYAERLVLTRPVTLEAAPGAEGRAVVEHATELPYEATLQIEAPGVAVRGLKLRHTSPSIAANYCVLVRAGGELVIERCDVSSATGSGLGCEGGVVVARGCALSDCKLHGAALYGDLMGTTPGESRLEAVTAARNGGCGALLRDGAAAALRSCTLEDNRLYGASVVDSTLTLVGCTLKGNRKGALLLERVRGIDMEANALDTQPTVLDS